jgi:hypothetical protein
MIKEIGDCGIRSKVTRAYETRERNGIAFTISISLHARHAVAWSTTHLQLIAESQVAITCHSRQRGVKLVTFTFTTTFLKGGPQCRSENRPTSSTSPPIRPASASEAARNAERRKSRTTPMTPSQASRKSKVSRRSLPKDHYTIDSYRRAVVYPDDACRRLRSQHIGDLELSAAEDVRMVALIRRRSQEPGY